MMGELLSCQGFHSHDTPSKQRTEHLLRAQVDIEKRYTRLLWDEVNICFSEWSSLQICLYELEVLFSIWQSKRTLGTKQQQQQLRQTNVTLDSETQHLWNSEIKEFIFKFLWRLTAFLFSFVSFIIHSWRTLNTTSLVFDVGVCGELFYGLSSLHLSFCGRHHTSFRILVCTLLLVFGCGLDGLHFYHFIVISRENFLLTILYLIWLFSNFIIGFKFVLHFLVAKC
jgi:hypothetical protein